MEGFSSLVSSLIVPIPTWSDGYRYCVDIEKMITTNEGNMEFIDQKKKTLVFVYFVQ